MAAFNGWWTLKAVATENGEPTSELSIMEKLLLPAAEVLTMDATDSSCGDQLLKEMGKKVRLNNGVVQMCSVFVQKRFG